MCRCACLMLIAFVAVCGCKREAGETQAPAATTSQEPAVQTQAEKPQTPPAPAVEEHPVLAVARDFLHAVAGRYFDRAIAQGAPGTFSRQQLVGVNQAFQMDEAVVANALLGAGQAAVVTNLIPIRQSPQTAAWGFALTVTEDGRWQIRSMDFLPNQDTVDTFLAAFREVESQAKTIGL